MNNSSMHELSIKSTLIIAIIYKGTGIASIAMCVRDAPGTAVRMMIG
jgi:hypothetical protein